MTVPLVFKPEQLNHDFHWLLVMGRLKPGVTIKQAQQNMDAVTAHIAQVYPKSDKGWGSYVEPLKNDFLPKERIQMLWLLLGAVGFVLLIACVNVANLLLARGMARQKELAVRSALGAGRSTIFAQLADGEPGAGAGRRSSGRGRGLRHAAGPDCRDAARTRCPARRTCASIFPSCSSRCVATTLAGLLAGSAPAWYASRVDPAETLKEGGRSRHQRRQASPAADSGHRRVRAGAGAAGRRGPGHPQLLESHPRGSGHEDRSRADFLLARARLALERSGPDTPPITATSWPTSTRFPASATPPS